MGSMHWTPEESRYLKAIFSWQDRFDGQLPLPHDGGPRARDALANAKTKTGVGDLRVLVVGAPGVGKTALLTRFCADSFDEDDDRFARSGRRPVWIGDSLYNMDILEMPSQHIVDLEADAEWPVFASTKQINCPSPAAMMLEQALAITEAAIVVYDVCDASSFAQARRLYERLAREHKEGEDQPNTRAVHTSASAKPKQRMMRFRSYKRQRQEQGQMQPHPARSRPFALLLVGNKSDAEGARCVASAEGASLAGGRFLETSAKTGEQVDEVFEQIGRDILGQRQVQEAVSANSETNDIVMQRDSSSASSSKSRLKRAASRRSFMQRLGLSLRRVI